MTWCEWPGYLIGNEAVTNYGCRMFGGLWVTLQLVAISVGLGVILGFLVALVRLYGGPVSSRVALGYTTFFRGTPLLCQLFLVYYGAGQFRPALEAVGLWGYFRDAFFCAAFTFTINTAAYQAEIFRGAIASVPRGQWEAAKALGLRFPTILRTIIMPQATLVALRPLGNELVIMVKSSAVASLVTIFDLMGTTRLAFARSFDLTVYLFAAILYLLIVEIIRRVWTLAERRLTRHLSHA
jgi:polar amino acid transport system permease protein